MRFLRLISLVILMLTVVCLHVAYAGTVGKISGVVLDSKEKTPVPGARVLVEGTTMGAVVNPANGSYVIQNVPPGTYTLVCTCIGYNKTTITNILVHIDVTTEQNFSLISEAYQVDSVVVIGVRKEIDKYETSAVDRIGSKEIDALPVTSIQGILKTQTGFVSSGGALHVRGSRAGELAYVDDGVTIRDQLGGYGQSSIGGNESTPVSRLSMNMSSSDIEDVSIMKGNYSAEYGDMAGGLVTTNRKEGSNRLTQVDLEFRTDDLGFSELNKYSFNEDQVFASLSGPLPLLSDQLFPRLGLKWPGETISYYGSFFVDKYDTYVDYNDYDSPKSKIDYGSKKFLGLEIPNRRVNGYSGMAKLTWKMDPNSRYKLNFRYSREWNEAQNFQYDFLYTPSTSTFVKNMTEVKSARFSFNPPFLKDTFGELQYSEVLQTYERLPGGLNPSNFYVPVEGFEGYTDDNGNDQWDAAEIYEDLNSDGVWGEPYVDANFNTRYDAGESYTDLNNNGYWDPEPFEDRDGDGIWDQGEEILNDAYYVDVNGDGMYDDGDSVYTDQDGQGNGIYDPQLADMYNEDDIEPWSDGDYSYGEPFDDLNGNGIFDEGFDIWLPINDLDHNGQYTSPQDDWSEGIPYIDFNDNGRYDRPNGTYDYGEHYTDTNGNGRHDYSDQFMDFGYDQWAQYHYDYTRTRSLGFDLTSQVSRYHDIKAGFEFKFHKIVYEDLQYPYYSYDGPEDGGAWSNIERVIEVHDTTGNGLADEVVTETYTKGIFRDFYTRTPKDGAFYIRDKIEYGELIANIGFRYEFFIQAREAKDSVSLENEGLGYRQIIDSQQKLAPRIAFSFPISEKAKLMFNYGHFYQRPGFSKYYQRRTQASAAAAVFGNPNLDYEKTILYEIGVQYAIAEGYKIDISGYFKDQYGLLNSVPEGITPNSPDFQDNVDYARSRGLEFEFEKKYGQFIAGSIKYEYAWAFGKSSSDRSDYYIRFAGGEISIKENPLDWDIRHQLTLQANLNANKGEHPHFGIFKLPDDWNLSASWSFKSGRPFTPEASYPGLTLSANEEPETNSQRMPATSTVDIEFDKNFQVYGMNYTLILMVNNLFNYKNIDEVFESTGMANSDLIANQQIITGLPIHSDPINYTAGRQIMCGLKVRF